MKFIVKLQSEITIKSRPVRKRFTKILETNIKNVLRRID
jgi:thiamine biosynthesis protein ThiI